MVERVTPEKLRDLFVEVLQNNNQFTFLEGVQPFLITFAGKPFYIYIKHLSSAYFKDRPDTTRAQLHIMPIFEEVKKSSIPFVFLGYDACNDVYVCWNYHVVKNRLNEKTSVSFYSRESFQSEVQSGTFLRKKLKNDDIPVFFKREDLVLFFSKIETLFIEDEFEFMNQESDTNEKPNGKIYRITDSELIKQIKAMMNQDSYQVLTAIALVKNYYGDNYPDMKYSDWSKLVKSTKELPEDDGNNTFFSDKQLTMKELIVDILRQKGGKATYHDIYSEFEHNTGCSITDNKKAGIRATLERFSSDSSQFLGKEDLFYCCGDKGCGYWGLRELPEDSKQDHRSSLSEELALKKNYDFITSICDYLFNKKIMTEKLLNILCDKRETDKLMGCSCPYPILLKLCKDENMEAQIIKAGKTRYYKSPVYEFNGEEYLVSSEWYGSGTTKKDTKSLFIKMINDYLSVN